MKKTSKAPKEARELAINNLIKLRKAGKAPQVTIK